MNNRKSIPVISIAAGITLIIIGLLSSVSYIVTAIDSSNLADQSLTFWYLPFLLFGIVFLIVGTLYTVLGFKSFNGNDAAYKTTKILLIILFSIVLIISSIAIINSFIS